MTYDYKKQRAFVFTEEGQLMLLAMRDTAREHIEHSGAVCYAAITTGCSGSSWDILACVDRLVEIGDLTRLSTAGPSKTDIFISKRWGFKRRS